MLYAAIGGNHYHFQAGMASTNRIVVNCVNYYTAVVLHYAELENDRLFFIIKGSDATILN